MGIETMIDSTRSGTVKWMNGDTKHRWTLVLRAGIVLIEKERLEGKEDGMGSANFPTLPFQQQNVNNE